MGKGAKKRRIQPPLNLAQVYRPPLHHGSSSYAGHNPRAQLNASVASFANSLGRREFSFLRDLRFATDQTSTGSSSWRNAGAVPYQNQLFNNVNGVSLLFPKKSPNSTPRTPLLPHEKFQVKYKQTSSVSKKSSNGSVPFINIVGEKQDDDPYKHAAEEASSSGYSSQCSTDSLLSNCDTDTAHASTSNGVHITPNSVVSKTLISSSSPQLNSIQSSEGAKSLDEQRAISPPPLPRLAQVFDRLTSDLVQHCEDNSQDLCSELFNRKMNVRQKLLSALQNHIPNVSLFVVGSTVTNLANLKSDVDMCLVVPWIGFGPGGATITGEINQSRQFALEMLKFARNRLRKCSFLQHPVELIPASVPILKIRFQPPFEDLEADVNVNNLPGLFNSVLLHYYERTDSRFRQVVLAVKKWAGLEDINDARNGSLNSYSLVLMVLHYLQLKGVLPNLQHCYPEFFSPYQVPQALKLCLDLPGLSSIRLNDVAVGEILTGFFEYFSEFDFGRYAISIKEAKTIDRNSPEFLQSYPRLAVHANRHYILIEEPFEGKNTAKSVYRLDKFEEIRCKIRQARNRLRIEPTLHSLFSVE